MGRFDFPVFPDAADVHTLASVPNPLLGRCGIQRQERFGFRVVRAA